ncbi:MAG TPA: EamA family transporter [Candidatus Acidoferrum sp.]|nr:EamA family transporter [Candidatus Acidoferrum sp.]
MSSATLERSSRGAGDSEAAPSRNSTTVIVAFGLVYLVWGSTYLAIRVGVESFPPLLLAGARHLLTGLILYPILRWKTGVRPSAAHWRASFVTGFLLLCIGNGGVCMAERTVPSGVTALLVATVSLWMVLVDWLRPGGLRPGPRVVAGLLLGFGGLALLVGPKEFGGAGRVDPTGVGILVIASLAWASGSVYSKHAGGLSGSPLLGVAMQSLAGGVSLWIAGIISGELGTLHVRAITARSWIAMGYLVLFGSMVGFTAYIYILKKSTATRVATYAFVNPVVALFLGWLLVGESIHLRTIMAAGVILTAVLLVITAPHAEPPALAERTAAKAVEA